MFAVNMQQFAYGEAGLQMKVVAFIEPPQEAVIEKILRHRAACGRPPLGHRLPDQAPEVPHFSTASPPAAVFDRHFHKGNRIQDEIENDHLSLEETGRLWLAAFKAWAPHLSGPG